MTTVLVDNKLLLVLVCTLGLAVEAGAQTANDAAAQPFNAQTERPATGTIPRSAYPIAPVHPPARKQPGIALGDFLLLPEFAARLGYDDNVFATPSDEKEDVLAIFSPSMALKSNWRRNRVQLNAGGDFGRYNRFTSENYNDYYFDGSGRLDLTRRANLFGGGGYSYNHEARTSPDVVNGTEPTVYTDTHGFVGSALQLGKVSLRLGANASRLNFSNVPSSTGLIFNDGRDRTALQAGARILYAASAQLQPFVQGNYDRRLYVTAEDAAGYRRDSSGYRLAVGLRFQPGPNLEGEALAGILHQRYADARFSAITRPDFGLRLAWRRSAVSTLGLFADRRLEETNLAGSAGYVSTRTGVNMERSITSRWDISAHIAFMNNAYQDVTRTDRVTDTGLGLSYQITPHLALEAEYRLLNRDSDDPAADYFSNQLFVGIRSRIYPVPPAPYSPPVASAAGSTEGLRIAGAYFGTQAIYGSLDTSLSGVRGEGTESAGYGNSGASYGLFAGYGFMHKRWYWGLEAHAANSNTDWTHDKPGGRVFSVEKHQSYGVDARLGYLLDTGALLFTRFGGTWSGFETRYQLDATSPAVRSDDTVFGRRYGLGVDVPLSSHLFMRMGYTYTDYNSYSVDYGEGTETFANSAGLFSVGLGWMLEGHDIAAPRRRSPSLNIDGFYAGVTAGYGSLNSPFYADQTQSSGPPTTLAADFSSHGMTSDVFAGYGITVHHLYLGLEADSEVGKANWAHSRQLGGRSFSVSNKGDQALKVRLGWALDNGTLFYAYFGRVRSKFHTTYIKGNNAAYWIADDNKEIGNRYGLGVDIPLTQAFFLRLDYSYTHFDPYQFTTEQSFPDTVRLTNNETLFRIGLGFRL